VKSGQNLKQHGARYHLIGDEGLFDNSTNEGGDESNVETRHN
jgi:hypothetical protein